MTEFLILLLTQVTIFSSVTALIIITVKLIFKCRIPPGLGMLMWIVLLARLFCPILPESRISVYNYIPAGRAIMYSLENEVEDELSEREEKKSGAENPYVFPSSDAPDEDRDETRRDESGSVPVTIGEYIVNDTGEEAEKLALNLNRAILCAYSAGIALSLAFTLISYHRAKKRAKESSTPCTDERILRLYRETAEKIGIKRKKLPPLMMGETSMLSGCHSPVLICRGGIDERETSFVLSHELIHFKHYDNPILFFSSVISCFFWYNPLIWIVRNMLREDVEVLCDSRTIGYFSLSPSEYAKMICRDSLDFCGAAGCHMSAAGRSLKTRLRTIAHNKNNKFLPRAVSILLCAAVIMVCLTNPVVSLNIGCSQYIENYSKLTGTSERYLQLSGGTTVSDYLGHLSALLEKKLSPEYKKKIGNGSLEKLKRIVSGLDAGALSDEVNALITDEPLSVKSCALINSCVTMIITDGAEFGENVPLLPEYITAEDMSSVTESLTEAEGGALLMCYNRGVKGAEAEFGKYYTPAMMELIMSRINSEWYRDKLGSFYTEVEYDSIDMYSGEIRDISGRLGKNSSLYVIDPDITLVEETTLRKIIGAAEAGENENVYYLKKTEDGCDYALAEFLFSRAGFTAEQMFDGYARAGESSYVYLDIDECRTLSGDELDRLEKRLGGAYDIHACYEPGEDGKSYVLTDESTAGEIFDYLNRAEYVVVRYDTPELIGSSSDCVKDAVARMYSLGLVDAENGIIDTHTKLSLGESLRCAYKLVSSAVNVN